MVPVNIRIADQVRRIYLAGRNDLDVLKDIVINQEYALPNGLLPVTILDLGAHIGIASVFMATVCPGAQIVAVEANPAVLDQLRRNVEPLGVTVIHAAVNDRSGITSFFGGRATWGASLVRRDASEIESRVDARTLPELLESLGGHADLMKIDVEGAEWRVLAGGFPPHIGALVGEAHRMDGRPPSEFLARFALQSELRLVSGDDDRAVFWAIRTPSEQSGERE